MFFDSLLTSNTSALEGKGLFLTRAIPLVPPKAEISVFTGSGLTLSTLVEPCISSRNDVDKAGKKKRQGSVRPIIRCYVIQPQLSRLSTFRKVFDRH